MAKGAAIIVAHDSGKCVASCIAALPGDWEILLIDNGSEDRILFSPENCGQPVKYIRNQENVGFAGAVNQGVRLTSASDIVVLNPDAVAADGALGWLAEALAAPAAGAAGGLLVGDNGQPQKGFVVRRFPTLASSLCEILLVNRAWPSNPWNARYRCLDFDYSSAQEVEQPAGAALAFRRAAWESVGGFDEQFFPVWFEDVDFCRRLRDRGWKIEFCPQAVFGHTGAHSVSQLSFRNRQLYWYGNLLHYFRKHHSPWAVAVLRCGIVAGMLARILVSLAAGSESAGRAEAIRSYGQVLWQYGVRGPRRLRRTGTQHPAAAQRASK